MRRRWRISRESVAVGIATSREVSHESLDNALGSASRALLDSSTLIAYHSRSENANDLAVHLLHRIQADDDPLLGYFSTVSATELLVRPVRSGSGTLRLVTSWLREFPHLQTLDVTLDVAIQAATVRAISGMKAPDALIIASGMLAGCEVIVSNDKRWRDRLQPLFPQFRWIYLHDYV